MIIKSIVDSYRSWQHNKECYEAGIDRIRGDRTYEEDWNTPVAIADIRNILKQVSNADHYRAEFCGKLLKLATLGICK